MQKDSAPLASSILKTIASENIISANELELQDKPLEEILNAQQKSEIQTTEQSK